MSQPPLTLAANFPSSSDADWQNLVEKTLKGKPFEKAMESKSYDDISIHGLYTQSNATIEPQGQSRSGAWDICGPHWNPDVTETNKAIIEDLERGASTIGLKIQAGYFPGLAIEDLPAVLDGVFLDMASVNLLSGEEYEAAGRAYLKLLDEKKIDKDKASGNLGADPLGVLSQSGRLLTNIDDALSCASTLAADVSKRYSCISTYSVNTSVYHTAGASEAQELAMMLSTGLTYLKSMDEAGLDIDSAADQIQFNLAADADIYLTISKLRAARRLWARVLQACGAKTNSNIHIGAVSAVRMLSKRDPWVNVLRNTTACFGAGIGGADTITILPHDTMLGLPSGLSRRVARNIQVICQEESNLAAVSDPAAGSFAFESITSELCNKAWAIFQDYEAIGGAVDVILDEIIANDIEAVWSKRRSNIAKRKDAITGISEFPDINEIPLDNVGSAPSFVESVKPAGTEIDALPFHRLGEEFEALRDRSDEILAASGKRPQVFMANLGTVAQHTSRATFAKNYFEAGGVETIPNSGFQSTSQMVEAFRESGAKGVVISGSDDLYARAEGVVEFLKGAGAKTVYLAGKPKNADSLQEAGVNEFIYMGSDLLKVLERALNRLGA